VTQIFTQEFTVSKEMLADEAAWKVLQNSIRHESDKAALARGLSPHPYYRANVPEFRVKSKTMADMPDDLELWEFTAAYEGCSMEVREVCD
jgi:hypothetical protein